MPKWGAGCIVCNGGEKEERFSQLCNCPYPVYQLPPCCSTTQGLWCPLKLSIPTHPKHPLPPLISTSYFSPLAQYLPHYLYSLNEALKKNKRKSPTHMTAAALPCTEFQDTKQQEKKTGSYMGAIRLPPAQAPLLAQSPAAAIHSAWATGIRER